MKIALFNSVLVWENPAENRTLLEQKINALNEPVDLIVLPEMFTTGFTMNPKNIAEKMDGATISWLKNLANAKNCALTGSLVIEEDNNYFNRMVFVYPYGKIEFYDKRHLFTLAGEDKIYTAGKDKLIIEYKDFKICMQICYDLRFPVFVRNVEEYDAIIYVANWPKPRINAWDILLKARAVENMSYVIGANRVGVDENNLEYNGHSQAIDFLGNYLLEPQENEGVFIVDINKNKLLDTRKKLAFLDDRDQFELF